MGRKPTKWLNMPRGMRPRPRGNKIHYYLDTGEKPRREIPLGSDYGLAVQKWAELTNAKLAKPLSGTFAAVLAEYWKVVVPTKSPRSQEDNEDQKQWLLKFFDDPPAPLDNIEPMHIRQYLRWRAEQARLAGEARNEQRRKDGKPPLKVPTGHVVANREKALFSHVWNFARAEGYTKLPNPCQGIKGFKEVGRDVLVTENLLASVMAHSAKPLQFALRLADIIGQRPADVLRTSEAHVANGILHVTQGKTRAKLRFVIEGALETLMLEMAEYKRFVTPNNKLRVLALLVNERGMKLTAAMLRDRFDVAREAAGIDKATFQFRDLRAKAATETDDAKDTAAAQALLGHTTQTMTADYIRRKVGRKVSPIR